MKVDAKCDVYSFGVVALEVMMGKHPGDFISSLMLSASTSSSSPIGHNTLLKDVLDQRLPPPENDLADGVAHVAKIFSPNPYTPSVSNLNSPGEIFHIFLVFMSNNGRIHPIFS
ncbi:LEUCINE RICH REPEAT KINASE 2 [Salix purpurea]|uniref:non-specific serine/threonine protein kinase n=1 Tax=Salix purpurea TaxID=77065 RepID=A0A9Q0W5Q7_SALPP|nr:LEUCINE RICH REPEAT KINASE 2 [Salix purpurea]